MIRAYVQLIILVLIAIQIDAQNEPLVLGWHGLGLAFIMVIVMFAVDLYGYVRGL